MPVSRHSSAVGFKAICAVIIQHDTLTGKLQVIEYNAASAQ